MCGGVGPSGFPHAHVDNVFAASASGQFQFGCDIEDIGRKPIDARKAARASQGSGHRYSHVSARTVRATQYDLCLGQWSRRQSIFRMLGFEPAITLTTRAENGFTTDCLSIS